MPKVKFGLTVKFNHAKNGYRFVNKKTRRWAKQSADWKLFKHSVRSTHIPVSSKYVKRYLNALAFLSNRPSSERIVRSDRLSDLVTLEEANKKQLLLLAGSNCASCCRINSSSLPLVTA